MPNTLDKTNNQKGIFALFKGESGSGKSVAALSFPNVYVFDFDFKMPTIALKHFPGKSIDYDTYTDLDQLLTLMGKWLKRTTICPYETLVFDSFTHLCSLSMRDLANIKGQDLPELVDGIRKARASASPQVRKSVVTDWQDFDYYKAENKVADWVVNACKVLHSRDENPRHIIFTAHVVDVVQRNIVDRSVTHSRNIVSQGQKVGAQLPTNFDEEYIFTHREIGGLEGGTHSSTRFYAITQGTSSDSAKTAYRLDREIDFTDSFDKAKTQTFYDQLVKQMKRTQILDKL